VVGSAPADHLRTELVPAALASAAAARDRGSGVIFHAGRGCQYTSAGSAGLASDCAVTLSHGRTGQCWDNAPAESLFASIKGELPRPAGVAHKGSRQAGNHRVHRLVQRHPAAQHPQLPQPAGFEEASKIKKVA
jgi:transposase InsO family protein